MLIFVLLNRNNRNSYGINTAHKVSRSIYMVCVTCLDFTACEDAVLLVWILSDYLDFRCLCGFLLCVSIFHAYINLFHVKGMFVYIRGSKVYVVRPTLRQMHKPLNHKSRQTKLSHWCYFDKHDKSWHTTKILTSNKSWQTTKILTGNKNPDNQKTRQLTKSMT
jgi:hypothetical protein